MSVKLFVGFGGTGGKVLQHFARLVADDAQLADTGDRSFFFLLVDTDQRDLRAAESGIRAQFRRIPGCNPVIETLDLAENVDRMTDLVDQQIVNPVLKVAQAKGFETDALKTARRSWYFRAGELGATEPFAARRLPKPLRDGAGQCPLAGHFAAWHKLDALGAALERLKAKMLNRQNEDEGVDMFITGSLAGGTGRGCWQLLSLKAREIFPKCTPIGLFADASVFEREVNSQAPQWRYRLHVNSLTGLSEIAAWIRNDMEDVQTRSAFSFPQLRALGSGDHAIDSEKWAPKGSTVRGVTPIDHFYIITRSSDSLEFSGTDDVYRMMGAALFANTASERLQSRNANEEQFGSVGVGVVRVPIVELRDSMAAGAAAHAVGQLLEADQEAVKQSVGALAEPLMFGRNEVELGGPSGIDERSLLGTIADKLKDMVDCTNIDGALDRNESVSDVTNLIEEDRFADEREQAVAEAVRGALLDRMRRPAGKDPLVEFKSVIASELKKSLQSATRPGIGGPSAILTDLRSKLTRLQSFVSDWAEAKVPSKPELRKQLVDAVRERQGRSVPVFGRRWDEQERGEIASHMKQLAIAANYKKIVQEVHKTLSNAIQAVDEFDAAIRPVYEGLAIRRQGLEDEYAKHVSQCFLSEDDQAFLRQITDWHATEFKLHRLLRPADAAESRRRLQTEAVQSPAFTAARDRLLGEVARRIDDRSALGSLEQRSAWRQAAVEKVERELLPAVSMPPDRLLEVFRIERVLESIEARFRRYLDSNLASSSDVERVQDFFEAFFGRRFVREQQSGKDANLYASIPARQLLFELCYALAQQTDPMMRTDWRDKLGEKVVDKVSVFLPRQSASVTDEQWLEMLTQAQRVGEGAREDRDSLGRKIRTKQVRQVERYLVQDDLDTHYTIVSYASLTIGNFTTAQFDGIQSFDGWRTDPEVAEWLRRCEMEEHGSREASVWNESSGNIGLGYMFPFFVQDPVWRARRWAPWGKSAEVRASEARALDALLYALVGNITSKMESSGDAYVAEAKKILETVSAFQPDTGRAQRWTMPLLLRSDAAGDMGWTLTRKCFQRQGGGTIAATGGNWEPGTKFQTLREIVKRFGIGSGKLTADGEDFVRAVNEERMLVVGRVKPAIEDNAGAARRQHLATALVSFLDGYRDGYLRARPEEQRAVEMPVIEELRGRADSRRFLWDGEPV